MDVRFCEGRDHRREALMRAEDLDREVRALASAPDHVCFSLTEDLHGCRTCVLVLDMGCHRTWCARNAPAGPTLIGQESSDLILLACLSCLEGIA
jgi:hypothetical protein